MKTRFLAILLVSAGASFCATAAQAVTLCGAQDGVGNTIKCTPIMQVMGQSGVAAVTGSFTATGASASFTPIAGRPFNVTIDGTFSATVQIERSFDGGATWHIVFTDTLRASVPPSFSLTETEVGVIYRINCPAFVSGTANYRLSI